MISLKKKREAEGHNIRVVYVNGELIEDFCSHYMQSEDEEAAIFIGEHFMEEQSDIESITILD